MNDNQLKRNGSEQEPPLEDSTTNEVQLKPKFYPLKPKDEEGFKKAVAWFGGRELIASLKGIVMYAIYGENMDPRSWMKPIIYPNVEEKVRLQKEDEIRDELKEEGKKSDNDYEYLNAIVDTAAAEKVKGSETVQKDIAKEVINEWSRKIFDYWEWKRTHFGFWEEYLKTAKFWDDIKDDEKEIKEFWFDYIADSGDGQMGVYGVGCMCCSDLWLIGGEEAKAGAEISFEPPKKEDWSKTRLLPRGYFLFVGGDTAYHSANYATLFERFQTPFRWGFTSVRKYLFEKYQPKLDYSKSFFWSEGKKENIFDAAADGKPHEKWDGTISDEVIIPTTKEKKILLGLGAAAPVFRHSGESRLLRQH